MDFNFGVLCIYIRDINFSSSKGIKGRCFQFIKKSIYLTSKARVKIDDIRNLLKLRKVIDKVVHYHQFFSIFKI